MLIPRHRLSGENPVRNYQDGNTPDRNIVDSNSTLDSAVETKYRNIKQDFLMKNESDCL